MSVDCDPNALMQAAKCFSCIPKGHQEEVMLYLLAQIAGGSTDPATLMQEAKCFKCIPNGEMEAVMTYLLCQLAKDGAGPLFTTIPTGLEDQIGLQFYSNIPGLTGIICYETVLPSGVNFQDTNVTSISFPNLVSIDPLTTHLGALLLFNASGCVVSAPKLTYIGGTLYLVGSDNQILSAPLLAHCEAIYAFNCTTCTLNLPSLAVVGFFYADHTTHLSLILPSLVTTTFGIDANTSTIDALNLSSWVPTDGTTIDFHACNLTATMVEQILRRCVLAGVTTCTILLQGGTNAGTASLNPQGQADVVTLGAQLTINP